MVCVSYLRGYKKITQMDSQVNIKSYLKVSLTRLSMQADAVVNHVVWVSKNGRMNKDKLQNTGTTFLMVKLYLQNTDVNVAKSKTTLSKFRKHNHEGETKA